MCRVFFLRSTSVHRCFAQVLHPGVPWRGAKDQVAGVEDQDVDAGPRVGEMAGFYGGGM